MSAGAGTTPGQRPYNEDAYLIRDLSTAEDRLGGVCVFMLVSDGMGGHQAGDVASRVVVDVADAYIDDLLALAGRGLVDLDPAQALREIAAEAHQGIVDEAARRGAASMGATFVALFATSSQGWVAHVGDSRAYVVGETTPRQLTVDHSQVARMVAEGILTAREADSHPQRNVIERALGFSAHEPELSAFRIEPWNALALVTDGFSDTIDQDTVSRLAQRSESAQAAAALLAQEAQRCGTDDNATVAIWAPDWPTFTQAARLAPKRPATIQMPGAAVSQRRESPPAVSAVIRRRRTKLYGRMGLVILLAVAVAAVAWLVMDATRGAAGQEAPSPSPSSAKSVKPSPDDSPADDPPTKAVAEAQQISEFISSPRLQDTPVRATLKEVVNVRFGPSMSSGRKERLSGPARHSVWCWRYSRKWEGPLDDPRRLWYLVTYGDEAGVDQLGWVHVSRFVNPPNPPASEGN